MIPKVEQLEDRNTPSGFDGDFSAALIAGKNDIAQHFQMVELVKPIMQQKAEMQAQFAPKSMQFNSADLARVLIAIEADKLDNGF